MQKTNFITQLILEIKITYYLLLLWAYFYIDFCYRTHLKQQINICCFHRPLVISRNLTSYLNLFVRYCRLRNLAFWIVLRFLDHNSRIRFFLNMLQPYFWAIFWTFWTLQVNPSSKLFFKNWNLPLFLLGGTEKQMEKEGWKNEQIQIYRTLLLGWLSVHSLFCWEGSWTSNQIFKKGGLGKTSTFKGGLLGKRGWTFSRGSNFYIKNKLKSKIFNDKNVYKQKYFSLGFYL